MREFRATLVKLDSEACFSQDNVVARLQTDSARTEGNRQCRAIPHYLCPMNAAVVVQAKLA